MTTLNKIKIGQRYKDASDYKYILAQTSEDRVCLINLSDGNRWNNPVHVKDVLNITSIEWKRITTEDKFELI